MDAKKEELIDGTIIIIKKLRILLKSLYLYSCKK